MIILRKLFKQKVIHQVFEKLAKLSVLASSSTVHGHLSRLEEKGYIRRDPTKPRAIEIVSEQLDEVNVEETIHVPVIGKVTAGVPITAVENIEEYFPLPEHLTSTHNSDIFILNVVGESMIEAGILDGDKVIVRSQTIAENGYIIVAMTEDEEATVKRFYKEKIVIDYNLKIVLWSLFT